MAGQCYSSGHDWSSTSEYRDNHLLRLLDRRTLRPTANASTVSTEMRRAVPPMLENSCAGA